MLTLRWLKNKGGVDYIEKINNHKAQTLYDEIDRNSLFYGIVNKDDRSNMNVTFTLNNKDLESVFDSLCNKKGLNGIKGHRSVGGYRASLYNALPLESVEVLVKTMQDLEKNNK